MKRICINGIEYQSVRDACNKLGLSEQKIYYRLKKGMSAEEACNPNYEVKRKPASPAQKMNSAKGHPVVVDGVEYISLSAACRAYGIKNTTISQRLKYGYTIDEAFHFTGRDKRKFYSKTNFDAHNTQSFEYEGREYRSVRQFCKDRGIEKHYEQVVKRKAKGESIEKIINKIHKQCRERKIVEYEGVKYSSVKEFCEKKDILIQYSGVIKDLNQGLSLEEAYQHAIKVNSQYIG